MNLFQRLLMRRLMSESPADGGEGGAPAAGTDPAPASDPVAAPVPESGPVDEGKPVESAKEPDVDKPGEKEKPKEPEKKDEKPVVPEKYEFKAPEGVEQLDAQALAVFEPIAKELGLSQEQAQKLVDIYPQIQQQQAEAWSNQVADWGEQAKADKEIGGDKLTASVGQAQKALDQFGTPALREYLHNSGLGNHPELVRIFAKVGKAMAEDDFVMGGQGQSSGNDLINAFYPKK